MNSRQMVALVFIAMVVSTNGPAWGAACTDTFSNAVGTVNGDIDIKNNVRLTNTGSRVLAVGDELEIDDGNNKCDGSSCSSGSSATGLSIPSNTSGTDYDPSGTVSFAPGDYYYNNFTLDDSDNLVLTGSGTVRIHVQEDVTLKNESRVNEGGSANRLVFFVGDDFYMENEAEFVGFVYANDRFNMKNDAVLTGAGVGNRSELENRARINYVAPTTADFDGVCTSSAPVTSDPIAAFGLDEENLNGTAGELADEQGNFTAAFALGTGSGVQSTATAQICRALEIPSNTTESDKWGADSGIDVDDDIGSQGAITFWYRAASNWNSGTQRMLLDASQSYQTNAKFFHVSITGDGRVQLAIEDSNETDLFAETPAQSVSAGTWKHIGVTWDLPNDTYQIYLDGVLVETDTDNSNGSIGELQTLYIGDNRSNYHYGGSDNSANGIIDEVRIYDSAVADSIVLSDFQRTGAICPDTEVTLNAFAEFRFEEEAGLYDGSGGEVVDTLGVSTSAFASGSSAGVDTIADGKICRGVTIPDNNSDGTDYFIDTGVDPEADLGDVGSIAFWYRSNRDWNGGGSRMLLDASETNHSGAKYFYLELQNNGRLDFGLEDSADRDIRFQTAAQSFGSGTWVHIAITWDLPDDRFEIYINGALSRSYSYNSTGRLGTLDSLVLGDARSNYTRRVGGSGNSGDGDFDELRLYGRALTAAEVANDYTYTRSCDDELETVDAGGFNCVVSGADPIDGHLFLQKVSTAFNVDIVALRDTDSDGSMDQVETEYAADADRSVTVEFVDASSGGACGALPLLSPTVSQTVVFGSANAGRLTTSAIISRAYPELRCRVTDTAPDSDVVACSTDSFAVRPTSLLLSAPIPNSGQPGDDPLIAAGALFTLTVDGGAGYSGTPAVDASKVAAHSDAVHVGSLVGVFPSADDASGTSTATDAFSYNEVGSFRFAQQGLYDDSFAAVDIANGDCTDDFSNTLVGDQYGCKFGNTAETDWIGRFYPAGFTSSVQEHGAFGESCGSFSYQGQPVTLSSDIVFRIVAKALDGSTTTRNYTGNYAFLETNDVALVADETEAGVDGSTPVTVTWTGAGNRSLTDLGDMTPSLSGQHDITISDAALRWGLQSSGQRLSNDRVAPFTTAPEIRIASITERDAGDSLIGSTDVATPTGVDMRYGRLALGNAHGSELSDLLIRARTEYYTGGAGLFTESHDDSCSSLLVTSGAILLDDLNSTDDLEPNETCGWAVQILDQTTGSSLGTCSGAVPVGETYPSVADGRASFFLQAPFEQGETNTGVLQVSVEPPAHLQYDWTGDGTIDVFDYPTGRATFGIFNRATSVIYQREVR